MVVFVLAAVALVSMLGALLGLTTALTTALFVSAGETAAVLSASAGALVTLKAT